MNLIQSYLDFSFSFSDMNRGLHSVYDTASGNGTSTDVGYHQYLHHSARSDGQARSYTSDYPNSLVSNGHSRFDDNESEHLQRDEQQLDDNDDEIAPDRPKLLMWGLTK